HSRGELTVPFHDLVRGRLLVDRVFEIRYRDPEHLQNTSGLVTRHRPFSFRETEAHSSASSGTPFQRGSPAGLKFFVLTKWSPWWRFTLNLPPPHIPAIQPSGSSRNGVISSDVSRASHLKRIVPAQGCCTPIVTVMPGHTRRNSSRICFFVGRSTPRFSRF